MYAVHDIVQGDVTHSILDRNLEIGEQMQKPLIHRKRQRLGTAARAGYVEMEGLARLDSAVYALEIDAIRRFNELESTMQSARSADDSVPVEHRKDVPDAGGMNPRGFGYFFA